METNNHDYEEALHSSPGNQTSDEENGSDFNETSTTQKIETPDPLVEAQKRILELNERYLRLNAEFDNFKKRMIRENSDRLKYHYSDLVKELLPAVDSLEKAISHAKQSVGSQDPLLQGIEMVYKIVIDAFGKFHIIPMETEGKPFDPNHHQALGMLESEDVPENHVVDQFQAGYFLHDRVVRPAMVRISKKS